MVLNWLDYAVIAVYLFGIIAFGSWFARFQKTTRDYFLTGRSVPWWAICRNVMLPAYAPAGTPMKLSVLVSVATMVKQMAHHGTERPVRK